MENQRLFLQGFAKANNYYICTEFEDPAVSGSVPAAQRCGFSALLAWLRANHCDAVLIYELSRVGRTFYDTLDAIKAVERYAPLISCSPKEAFLQTIDPNIRKLLITILSWVAEREREVLVTRIKAGIERVKAEGKPFGRPRKQIDQQKLQEMLASSIKIDEIAASLDISKPTLYKNIRQLR